MGIKIISITIEQKLPIADACSGPSKEKMQSCLKLFLSKCISILAHLDPMLHTILASFIVSLSMNSEGYGTDLAFNKQTIFVIGMMCVLIVEELM